MKKEPEKLRKKKTKQKTLDNFIEKEEQPDVETEENLEALGYPSSAVTDMEDE